MKAMRFGSAILLAAVATACRDGGPTQANANPDVVAAGGSASVLAVAPWSTAYSPTAGATVTANGMAGTATMSYASPYNPTYGMGHFWRFTTTASEAAIVTLPWTFSGFHSWYDATARLRVYINRGGTELFGPYLVNGGVSGGFSYSGTTTFSVQAGDAYGFEVYGYHYDGANVLNGTLSVTVPLPPPPASPPSVSLAAASGNEGASIAFAASASDPDRDITGYAWDFGDGTTVRGGDAISHTYAQDGSYTVQVTVTDATGLTASATTTVDVANVLPSVAPFAGALIQAGETYTASGSFNDPGTDPWRAYVDYGDGAGPVALALSGQGFVLSHTYATAGAFDVTVKIVDDDGAGGRTVTVVVQSPPPPPSDVTPPTIVSAVAGTLGGNGWYTSNVGLTWSVSDGESAVTSSTGCGASTVNTDTNGLTVTCTAASSGGSATGSVTVKRDATPPVIAFAGNAGTYTADQQISISCSATDAMSGIAASSCPGATGAAYAFGPGTHTLSATATDRAGNATGASTLFTVQVTAASVTVLVNQWVNQKGVASAMAAQLRSGAYEAFRNHVRAQTGKSISAANAAILISLSQSL
jgi:hypothetical protein